MSRRHRAEKRFVLPDVKYGSVLLAQFINKVMYSGKKALAERIVYSAFDSIARKHKCDAFEVFNNAIRNVKPSVEVISVRVGGANYQVPSTVTEGRGVTLAIRWVIDASKKRSELSMIAKLAEEIFDAANSKGGAIKKREDTHRTAEGNKAFAHLNPKRA